MSDQTIITPTYLYARGLERLAEQNGVGISEAAILGLTPGPHNVVRRKDFDTILAAHASLNPGVLYVQGLRAMSNVTKVLRDATKVAVGQARRSLRR